MNISSDSNVLPSRSILSEADIAAIRSAMVDNETAVRLSVVFKAIGDTSRVKMIYALLQQELCVGDLAEVVGISQSAVSHQLRTLRNLRLVKTRRVGQMIYYSLDDHHIINLLSECLEHLRE